MFLFFFTPPPPPSHYTSHNSTSNLFLPLCASLLLNFGGFIQMRSRSISESSRLLVPGLNRNKLEATKRLLRVVKMSTQKANIEWMNKWFPICMSVLWHIGTPCVNFWFDFEWFGAKFPSSLFCLPFRLRNRRRSTHARGNFSMKWQKSRTNLGNGGGGVWQRGICFVWRRWRYFLSRLNESGKLSGGRKKGQKIVLHQKKIACFK